MNELPTNLRRSLETALESVDGRAQRLIAVEPVGGGCIHETARVETDRGLSFFLKWSDAAPPGIFEAEADGLAALGDRASSTPLRVPAVVAHGDGGAGPRWLLMEFVPKGRGGAAWGTALGRAMAALHGTEPAAGWGWERDNFIGALPQTNHAAEDWPRFWADRRLLPQLERARRSGALSRSEAETVASILPRVAGALAGVASEGPSLLHGDLWSGNVYPGPAGEPVLVDPAVYRGHREVDLAMSELFGGFPAGWMEAYREATPLAPGYAALRRPLYQLYYLLVHVNLFGRAYAPATLAAARAVGEGL